MKLLDLFCCAGGAAMGYHQAGFEVTGIDIKPQPHYPFKFIQADALDYLAEYHSLYDAFNASPPCQKYSAGAAKWKTQNNHPDLIVPTRTILAYTGKPYVIENIMPAGKLLIDPFMLCGTMFGLGVFRHRLFEVNFPVFIPNHSKHTGRIGDGKYCTVTGHAGGGSTRDGWKNGNTNDWKKAMGIDWMTGNELREAIPPAYTKFIGEQLMTYLKNNQ
jgi:DNA (cytosine-5)-methyltransferase 1